MGEAKKITVYLYHGDDFDSTVYQFTDTTRTHLQRRIANQYCRTFEITQNRKESNFSDSFLFLYCKNRR